MPTPVNVNAEPNGVLPVYQLQQFQSVVPPVGTSEQAIGNDTLPSVSSTTLTPTSGACTYIIANSSSVMNDPQLNSVYYHTPTYAIRPSDDISRHISQNIKQKYSLANMLILLSYWKIHKLSTQTSINWL